MRSEGFLFLSGGLGAGSCLPRFRGVSAERPRRVRLGVAIARCNSARLERVAACVCMDVSRGRRGEWCDLLRRRASFCVAGTAGFRGPVRENVCAPARGCMRRCEIVAGAGNR